MSSPCREPTLWKGKHLIIYTWHIMEGQVLNIGEPNRGGIKTTWHIRRGRVCIVPTPNNQTSGSVIIIYNIVYFVHNNKTTRCGV